MAGGAQSNALLPPFYPSRFTLPCAFPCPGFRTCPGARTLVCPDYCLPGMV